MTTHKRNLALIMTALFTAMTYVATQFIRIPMPTGAFVHTGNVMVLLSVLLLGYKKGALAGGLGLALFDLLNGYATEAPYFILESFIVGAAAWFIYHTLFKENVAFPKDIWKIVVVSLGTGITKIIMTQIKNTVMLVITGAKLKVAFSSALITLPATFINVGITIVLVTLLFFPLKKALHAFSM